MSDIQYNTNAQGEKTSVTIPYQEWLELNARLEMLRDKLRILTGIQEAVLEVREAQKGGKKLQKLTDFIRESRNKRHG
jgi:hypothetical protein